MESLRFLMVTTFYPPYHLGGDAVHVKYLAEALAERGHEVHVEFSPAAYRLKRGGGAPALNPTENGIDLHPVPSPLGRLQPVSAYVLGRSRGVTRFHARLVEDLRPDVVHYHNISLLGLGVLDRAASARTLYTAHDYWVRCPRSDLFKYGRYPCDAPTCIRCSLVSRRPPQLWRGEPLLRELRTVDRVIAPSRFVAQAIARQFPCPIVHIPNFAPDPNSSSQTHEPDAYYLYVGVHEAHKGVIELASIATHLPRGISLKFVGGGTLVKRLRRMQRDSLSNIEVAGWVDRARLAEFYRRARALVVPSLWHENAPLVATEALSWGSPLIVSRRGGLEELIRGGEAGVSCEPSSSRILDAIANFEENDLSTKLRRNARNAYETHHTTSRYLQQYLSILDGTATKYETPIL